MDNEKAPFTNDTHWFVGCKEDCEERQKELTKLCDWSRSGGLSISLESWWILQHREFFKSRLGPFPNYLKQNLPA